MTEAEEKTNRLEIKGLRITIKSLLNSDHDKDSEIIITLNEMIKERELKNG